MERVGREPAEQTTLGVDGATIMLTAYLTVYDSLPLWYRSGGMERNPLRNRHFSGSQMDADGFRGCLSQVRETLFSGIRHEGFESHSNGRT